MYLAETNTAVNSAEKGIKMNTPGLLKTGLPTLGTLAASLHFAGHAAGVDELDHRDCRFRSRSTTRSAANFLL